jgi:hypothetical protein
MLRLGARHGGRSWSGPDGARPLAAKITTKPRTAARSRWQSPPSGGAAPRARGRAGDRAGGSGPLTERRTRIAPLLITVSPSRGRAPGCPLTPRRCQRPRFVMKRWGGRARPRTGRTPVRRPSRWDDGLTAQASPTSSPGRRFRGRPASLLKSPAAERLVSTSDGGRRIIAAARSEAAQRAAYIPRRTTTPFLTPPLGPARRDRGPRPRVSPDGRSRAGASRIDRDRSRLNSGLGPRAVAGDAQHPERPRSVSNFDRTRDRSTLSS